MIWIIFQLLAFSFFSLKLSDFGYVVRNAGLGFLTSAVLLRIPLQGTFLKFHQDQLTGKATMALSKNVTNRESYRNSHNAS